MSNCRVLATLAGQTDLVEAFRNGEDVYRLFAATRLYHKAMEDVEDEERRVAKSAVLGSGFGMSAPRFRDYCRIMGIDISEAEAERVIKTYRTTYHRIPTLWKTGDRALRSMVAGGDPWRIGPCTVYPTEKRIELPNGLSLHYPGLRRAADGDFYYRFKGEEARVHGPRVIENIVQALARIILATAELRLAAFSYEAALSVHDELVYVVPERKAERFADAVYASLCTPIPWMPDLPLEAEVAVGDNYGEAK